MEENEDNYNKKTEKVVKEIDASFKTNLGKQIMKIKNLPCNIEDRKTRYQSYIKKDEQNNKKANEVEEKEQDNEQQNTGKPEEVEQKKDQLIKFRQTEHFKEEKDLDYILQQMNQIYQPQKVHNYFNLFGVSRGACKKCDLKQCPQYRGCYNVESYRSVELFSCLECQCPMNTHTIDLPEKQFSNELSELLSNKYIESQHLNFRSLVSIFYAFPKDTTEDDNRQEKAQKVVDSKVTVQQNRQAQQQQKEEKQAKKLNAFSYDVNIEKFVQIMNEGCFDLLSYYETTVQELKEILVEKKIFSIKKPTAKEKFQEMHSFIISIMKAEKEAKLSHNQKIEINLKQDLYKQDQYEKWKRKIQAKIDRISANPEKCKIYILLINSKYTNPYMQFRRLLVAAQSELPPEMKYFYSSKYKYKGIIDCQLFFPQFFQVHLSTFIVTQHFPSRDLKEGYGQQKDKENKERKDQFYNKISDKFKDYLDFNSFEIIKGELNVKKDQEIYDAFNFMAESDDWIRFLVQQQQALNVKITAKIGPPTFTNISSNPINYYRITDPNENAKISQAFCSGLGKSQRVIIILRPMVVRSNIDELLLQIFRINQFIIIKRVFKLLNDMEADLLARIEGIKRENRFNYIKMMQDGQVSIILMSKPGAQFEAKMLANGCEEGLKMQKTNFLEELVIEHETESKLKFKEKLQKEFYNVFQSYSNLNMFNGLKDFFNLERLIFVDDEVDDFNNIFIQEDTNQTFFKTKSEIKTKFFSNRKRTRIMEEINEEVFNFFIYSTQNETATEQICSMFMPECSIMEQILLLVKPDYIDYREEIEQLLKRLKYKIIKAVPEYEMDEKTAHNLVVALEILKIPDQKIKQIAQQFQKQFYIISCVKPAGKKEMTSYLQAFRLEPNPEAKKAIKKPLVIPDLKEMLIPCWNDNSHKIVQEILNNQSQIFDGDDYLFMDFDNKNYMINYILEITFADGLQDPVNEKKDDYKQILFMNPLYPDNFVHVRAASENQGEFEVRLLKFRKKLQLDFQAHQIWDQFKLTSWYYSKVNEQFSQRAPMSYQFKILPEYTIPKPTHIFDVQEYCGGFFLETVAQLMQKARATELNERLYQKLVQNKQLENEPDQDHGRSSMVAYLWGMKLAQFVKELEQISEFDLEGFGPIVHKDDKYQGDLPDDQTLLQLEYQGYDEIIKRILKEKDLPIPPEYVATFENQITSKLDSIVESEIYKHSRKKFMRRIYPSFMENENIRVSIDKAKIQTQLKHLYYSQQQNRQLLHGQFQFFDQMYEQMNEEINKLVQKVDKEIKNEIEMKKLDMERQRQSKNKFENEDLDDNIFQLDKVKFQQMAKQMLNEEQYNTVMSQERISLLSISHTIPEIKSKYSLVANIKYMLKMQFKMRKQKELTNNSEVEYNYLVNGLIKGFDSNYKMDQEDLEYQQISYQNEQIKSGLNNPTIPDLINMELFLIGLKQMEYNLNRIQTVVKELEELMVLKKKEISDISSVKNKLESEREQLEIFTKYGEQEKDKITKKKILKDQIANICTLIGLNEGSQNRAEQDFKLYFNYQESKNKELQGSSTIEKVQIERDKYFLPTIREEGEYFFDPNLRNVLYRMDIMQSDLNKKILDPKSRFKEQNNVYFQKPDEIQKQWFDRKPLMINHMRDQKSNDSSRGFNGVLVQKEKIDQNKQEYFIQREIKKFKRVQAVEQIISERKTIDEENALRIAVYNELESENKDLFDNKTEYEIDEIVDKQIKDDKEEDTRIQKAREEREQKIKQINQKKERNQQMQ